VCDKVRERENGQGMWVHGGDHVSGMVWHWCVQVYCLGQLWCYGVQGSERGLLDMVCMVREA
jgi:hypothetical protein